MIDFLWNAPDDHNLMETNKKVFSEYHQDGIIEKIFDLIGTTNKYFVEFGSSGGKNSKGNTPFLRERLGFNGLLMDDKDHHGVDYDVKAEFITAENVNNIFEKYDVPEKFDFLSIDVDGEDYWIVKNLDLNRFTPRVLCIETNWHIPPPFVLVQKHDPKWMTRGWIMYGASIRAMKELLNTKGYTLVGASGPDAIFVLSDEIDKNNLHFKYANDDTNIYKLAVAQEKPDPRRVYFSGPACSPPDTLPLLPAHWKIAEFFTKV